MNPIAKIGFLIKGDYDPAVTYDFLDVVFYNGASYVAKKLTTGNTPVRKNEYWQIFAEGGTLTGTSDISDTTVAFQQAQERVNISTGESAKTLFGKIKKWFADLKGTAFSAPVTNLFATVTGNSLDATMGKKLKDLHDANKNEIDAVNASLSNVSAGLDISSNIVVHDFDAVYFSQGIGIPLYIFCPLNKTATLVSAKVKHYNEQVDAYRNLDLSKIRSYRQGFYVNFRLDMNEIGIPGDYATYRFNVSITVRYS